MCLAMCVQDKTAIAKNAHETQRDDMAISSPYSLGEDDMAHITQKLPRKQGQVGYMTLSEKQI